MDAKRFLLPCLGRIEIDRQATGPQFVTVEDTTGRFHASRGQVEPAGPTCARNRTSLPDLRKRRLATATLTGMRGASDYGLVRDAIAETYPEIFADFNSRILASPKGFDRPNPARERIWNTKTGKANFIAPICLSEDPDLPRQSDERADLDYCAQQRPVQYDRLQLRGSAPRYPRHTRRRSYERRRHGETRNRRRRQRRSDR